MVQTRDGRRLQVPLCGNVLKIQDEDLDLACEKDSSSSYKFTDAKELGQSRPNSR